MSQFTFVFYHMTNYYNQIYSNHGNDWSIAVQFWNVWFTIYINVTVNVWQVDPIAHQLLIKAIVHEALNGIKRFTIFECHMFNNKKNTERKVTWNKTIVYNNIYFSMMDVIRL